MAKLGSLGLVLLVGLALGVGGAAGRSLQAASLVVQVLGQGTVTGDGRDARLRRAAAGAATTRRARPATSR